MIQTFSDTETETDCYKLTMVIVYSCFREFMVLSSSTTIPPPSTVSTVLAKRLGVRASKSCMRKKTTGYEESNLSLSTAKGLFIDHWGIGYPLYSLTYNRNIWPVRHTCRTCFPGSCAFHCSNSSGCWLQRWRAQTGHLGSGSMCQFWSFSAAVSCASYGCCQRYFWLINSHFKTINPETGFVRSVCTHLLNPKSFL